MHSLVFLLCLSKSKGCIVTWPDLEVKPCHLLHLIRLTKANGSRPTWKPSAPCTCRWKAMGLRRCIPSTRVYTFTNELSQKMTKKTGEKQHCSAHIYSHQEKKFESNFLKKSCCWRSQCLHWKTGCWMKTWLNKVPSLVGHLAILERLWRASILKGVLWRFAKRASRFDRGMEGPSAKAGGKIAESSESSVTLGDRSSQPARVAWRQASPRRKGAMGVVCFSGNWIKQRLIELIG